MSSVVSVACRRVLTARAVFATARAGAMSPPAARWFSSSTDLSNKMSSLLKEKFSTDVVQVKDVSGGCGAFFQILVASPSFEGISTIKQHRAVNEVLESYIGKLHGLTLKTMTPKQFQAEVEQAK